MHIPRPFQTEAINLGIKRNMLLTDEVGLGKKVTGIEVARHFYRTITDKPVLVVTVKRDMRQWEQEIHRQDPTIPVVLGTTDMITIPNKDRFWLVLYYEALVRHIKSLARIQWNVVILDEGHYIKNWQAQRSRASKRLKAERKIVMTGTPIDRSPADLWSLLDFLYPEKYHGKLRAFREKHVKSYVDVYGRERVLPGAKDPSALAVELAQFTIGRTKAEVAPQLPPNIIKRVAIDLTGSQASVYRRIATSSDLLVDIPELDTQLYIPTRLAQLTRLQQVTTDPTLLGLEVESAKLEWVRDWLEDNPNEPVILFTQFRDTAHRLAAQHDAHLIAGGVPLPKEWTKRIIVGTIAAAAEALDLGWVRTAIFVDVTWKSQKMTQAMGRIHRLSTTEPCQTIHLTMPNTVDEVMLKAVSEKWDAYQLIRAATTVYGDITHGRQRNTPNVAGVS